MGFARKTPAGTHRACWRDPDGGQKSKSFRTKKEASDTSSTWKGR